MTPGRFLDLYDLDEATASLVVETELTGRRLVVTRTGRPIALVVSYDEVLSLEETLALTNHSAARERLSAPAEGEGGAALERLARVRLTPGAAEDWKALPLPLLDAAAVALERLDSDPLSGVPLLDPFSGSWSYRVGPLRILYRLNPEARMVLVVWLDHAAEEKA